MILLFSPSSAASSKLLFCSFVSCRCPNPNRSSRCWKNLQQKCCFWNKQGINFAKSIVLYQCEFINKIDWKFIFMYIVIYRSLKGTYFELELLTRDDFSLERFDCIDSLFWYVLEEHWYRSTVSYCLCCSAELVPAMSPHPPRLVISPTYA